MKNSLPFLDHQDASEGVKAFSEGVNLFSNQTPVCILFPRIKWHTLFFSVCICTNVLSFRSFYPSPHFELTKSPRPRQLLFVLLARWGSYHCKVTFPNKVRNLSYIVIGCFNRNPRWYKCPVQMLIWHIWCMDFKKLIL